MDHAARKGCPGASHKRGKVQGDHLHPGLRHRRRNPFSIILRVILIPTLILVWMVLLLLLNLILIVIRFQILILLLILILPALLSLGLNLILSRTVS